MSNKKLHIRFDLGIQHIASNRKGSIEPEYIDMLLSESVIETIYKKINPYVNSRREGFEGSLKRYSDLQTLKRTIKLRLVDGGDLGYVAPLPPDLLLVVPSVEVDLDVNYKRTVLPALENTNLRHYYVDFPNSELENRVHQYMNFALTLQIGLTPVTITIPSTYNAFTRQESKFMIVDFVIDALLELGFKVGWEKYGSFVRRNSFVFMLDSTVTGTLTFDTITRNATVDLASTMQPTTTANKFRVPVSLVSDKVESKTNLNKYYNQYTARNPIATIENNLIMFDKNVTYIPKYVYITYIKRPRLFNYRTDAVSEIEVTDEILALAVSKALSITGDPTYNLQSNQAIKID